MSERYFGAVVVPVTVDGRVLLIPNTSDNSGKAEGLTFSSSVEEVVDDHYQFPGGRREGDEEDKETLQREIAEEIGLEVGDGERLRELPVGTDMFQVMGGDRKLFGVHLFKLELTNIEEKLLRERGAVEEDGLNDDELRPRDRVVRALYKLLQQNEKV